MQKFIVKLLKIDFKNANYEIKITSNIVLFSVCISKKTEQINDKYREKHASALESPHSKHYKNNL